MAFQVGHLLSEIQEVDLTQVDHQLYRVVLRIRRGVERLDVNIGFVIDLQTVYRTNEFRQFDLCIFCIEEHD